MKETDELLLDCTHNKAVLSIAFANREHAGPYILTLENDKGMIDVQITTNVLGKFKKRDIFSVCVPPA